MLVVVEQESKKAEEKRKTTKGGIWQEHESRTPFVIAPCLEMPNRVFSLMRRKQSREKPANNIAVATLRNRCVNALHSRTEDGAQRASSPPSVDGACFLLVAWWILSRSWSSTLTAHCSLCAIGDLLKKKWSVKGGCGRDWIKTMLLLDII